MTLKLNFIILAILLIAATANADVICKNVKGNADIQKCIDTELSIVCYTFGYNMGGGISCLPIYNKNVTVTINPKPEPESEPEK